MKKGNDRDSIHVRIGFMVALYVPAFTSSVLLESIYVAERAEGVVAL